MSRLLGAHKADPRNPDNSPEKQAAYIAGLETLTDGGLKDEAESKIWLSAFAANNPRSCYHWQCDATYAEATRRGKPEIYSEAHKAAMRSEGYA